MKSVLARLAAALDPKQPEALLVGGQALPAYGVVRQTMDIDCLAASAGAAKLHQALLAIGYKVAGRSEAVVRYRHDSPMLVDVDVLVVGADTYDRLQRASRELCVGDAVWRVPALGHLIGLKLHAMKHNPRRTGHDLSDIVSLLQQNPNAVARETVRQLSAEFGPPGVFEELERMRLWTS